MYSVEKRLAVLIASLEEGLSHRETAAVHAVSTTTIEKWLREHFSGKVTLELLRASGKIPTEPVGSKDLAHAGLKKSEISNISLARDSIRRRAALKDGLIEEKKIISGYLTAIDNAIRVFDEDESESVSGTEDKVTPGSGDVDKNEGSIVFTLCDRVSDSEFDCSFCEQPVDVLGKNERVFLICKMCVSRMESRVARKMLSTITSR